jgi:hypothetical protein
MNFRVYVYIKSFKDELIMNKIVACNIISVIVLVLAFISLILYVYNRTAPSGKSYIITFFVFGVILLSVLFWKQEIYRKLNK